MKNRDVPEIILKRIREIQSLYRSAANQIKIELARVDVLPYRETDSFQVRASVHAILTRLNNRMVEWAAESVPENYIDSMKKSRVSLEILGRKKSPYFNKETHRNSISEIYNLLVSDFHKANSTMERTTSMILELKRQASLSVARIQNFNDTPPNRRPFDVWDMESAQGYFDSWAREAVLKQTSGRVLAKRIEDYLRDSLDDENFIEINGRHYALEPYAEMVARTRLREAQTEATKNMCGEYENDLVLFSSHANACEICAEFEDQVFSISGTSLIHPPLNPDVEPPLHPRCGHSISPTSDEAIAYRSETEAVA
jgi:hypothetical protein